MCLNSKSCPNKTGQPTLWTVSEWLDILDSAGAVTILSSVKRAGLRTGIGIVVIETNRSDLFPSLLAELARPCGTCRKKKTGRTGYSILQQYTTIWQHLQYNIVWSGFVWTSFSKFHDWGDVRSPYWTFWCYRCSPLTQSVLKFKQFQIWYSKWQITRNSGRPYMQI